MAYQTSPGINVTEIDLSTVVPAVSSTTGAIAGVFAWGPTLEPVLVSSETELVRRFGKPVAGLNIETFFSAADFLAYANSLYVVRADNASATAAASANVASNAYLATINAKYKGSLGNSLTILTTKKADLTGANTLLTSAAYGTPDANCVHIAVVDTTGEFTGSTTPTVIELFENVSINSGAKTADGTNNYYVDVINTRSNYIKIAGTPTATFNQAGTDPLTGGANGDSESSIAFGDIQDAYELFANPEDIDISLIIQGKAKGTSNGTQLANLLIQLAEARMDCVVFVSPESSDVVNVAAGAALTNIKTFANDVASSSYVVIDSGYKYRYDRYNDTYTYTPLNGDIAGLCARTDDVRDPWFSPAGYNRGGIKNIIKLAYNPAKADRDELYKASVNPVITQPGQGTVLFGDKTGLKKPSAFDRINVRRLFIVLEKAITRASKSTLFEFNDEFTRAQFRNLVEPFLRDVQGRRGIYDFKVVCDDTNNTSEVIDRNEFRGDIYIKPARSINFIQLNFVAVRTGVQFEEIIGKR